MVGLNTGSRGLEYLSAGVGGGLENAFVRFWPRLMVQDLGKHGPGPLGPYGPGPLTILKNILS